MGNVIQGTQSVSRAICILKMIAACIPQQGARLTDIAQRLDLEMPTAHRLLKLLTSEGLLIKNKVTSRYQLGPLIFELGLATSYDFNIIDVCNPILRQLSQATEDTSFLFIRNGNEAVCLTRVQGSYPIQTPVVPVGCRQPLGVSAGGLALLAALDHEAIDNILQQNVARLTFYGGLDIGKMKKMYERSKAQGYADIANTAVPGVRGIGIAVADSFGEPVAAIAIATTISRMTDNRIQEILPCLRDATNKVRQALLQ